MSNGRLPASQLATIPGTSQRVRADLAAQTAALRQAFAHRFGKPLVITDSYRPYDVQERIFRQRYTTAGHQGVNDVRWWNGRWWYRRRGTAAAAVPGTSNHGTGTALDFASRVNVGGSAEQRWMAANAPRFGWRWPAWARSAPTYEPWHYDATGVVPVASYRHFPGVSIPNPGGTAPDPLEPLMSLSESVKQWFRDLMQAWPKVADVRPDGMTTTIRGSTALARVLKIVRELREDAARAPWTYRGADETRDAYSYLRQTYRRVVEAEAAVTALSQAVAALAADRGAQVDVEAIESAARSGAYDGATEALGDGLTFDVAVEVTPRTPDPTDPEE